MAVRKIIHVDMDAFYASIEQRDNPALRGKPVAVGGAAKRGVVAAASYEARKYGIHSAMPSKTALRKCPHIIFVKPRFDVYKSISNEIREVFLEYTGLVEPLSLDEAYLDVTENKINMPSATIIAKEIKKKIKSKTKLTASAGVSYNKFLAKIASDYDKPDGLYLITPGKAEKFLEELPVEKFHGIGKKTAERLHKLRIKSGKDLKLFDKYKLIKLFGKHGIFYYDIVRGIDEREVNPSRIRKSVGAENTFSEDLVEIEDIKSRLHEIAERLYSRVNKYKLYGKTITVKIKFHDFEIITRSKTVNSGIKTLPDITMHSEELLMNEDLKGKAIRLLGISISNFPNQNFTGSIQLEFDFPL